MTHRQIRIKETFNEQYFLSIEVNSSMIESKIESLTEARYNFSVLKVNNDFIECRLIQTDIFIKETNSPLVKEIGELTALFNRMFNELHLRLSHSGEILEVLNEELILTKWNQTKDQMKQAINANDDLHSLMTFNDQVLNNPEKLKETVKANEFLSLYFGYTFGIDLPVKAKRIDSVNIFNTAKLPWELSVNTSELLAGLPERGRNDVTVSSILKPSIPLDKSFTNVAYQQFLEKLDGVLLKPELEQQEQKVVLYQSGKVKEVVLKKKEFVEARLYNELIFNLRLEQ